VEWFHFVILLPLNIFCRSVSNLSLLLFLVILIWACDCAAESKANAEAIKKIHVAMLERAAREAVYARMACDARASAEFNSKMGAERNREQSFVFHFTWRIKNGLILYLVLHHVSQSEQGQWQRGH
jgi:hypothetical protein